MNLIQHTQHKLSMLAACCLSCMPIADLAAKEPLKVYILAGQSNMQGHAHVDTMEVIGLDPKTAPMLGDMRNADGTHKVLDDVWISSIGSSEEEKAGKLSVGYGADNKGVRIGPEFTFGIYMQKHVKEPILIIKTAWGGKSLSKNFRPPSAGALPFHELQAEALKKKGEDVEAARAKHAEDTGHYYRLMTEHVHRVLGDIKRVYPDYDPKQGYELAGFVWFQGWNDLVDSRNYPNSSQPGGFDAYSEVLAHFIRDVRKEFSAPNLPFVIGVLGVNGPVSTYQGKRYIARDTQFRNAMAAPASMPEFKGNVVAVRTEDYWDQKLGALLAKRYGIYKEVSRKVKGGEIEGNGKKERDLIIAEAFTQEELDFMESGTSNAGYHYHGSAKILGQIGKAFADAAWQMHQK